MAYMHRRTFDIINNSNIDGILEEYFEIDDYIARPVQILNRKGYRTRFCCSGHPFETLNELTLEGTEDADPEELLPGVVSSEKLPDGSLRVVVRQALDCEAYITFEPAVMLTEDMPYGWRRIGDTMRCLWRYDDDPLVCMANVFKAMVNLTEWAEHLPAI